MSELAEPQVQQEQKPPFSILDSFRVVRESDPKPEEKPSQAEPEPKPVVDPTVTKSVTLPDPAARPLSPKASENFRKLEELKSQAERERDELKGQIQGFASEREAFQKRIEELEATMQQQRENSGNLEGLQLTVDEQKHKIAELRRELKAAAVTRDPEFQDRYIHGKKFQEKILEDVAGIVGVQSDEVGRALRLGDENRLQEIRDTLPPKQQRQWDAALLKMEQIDQERQLAEKDAEKTFETLQEQRRAKMQEMAKATASEDRKVAKGVLNSIYEKIPQLKENKDLTKELHSYVEGISGGQGAEQWTKDRIINDILMSKVYEGACANMHGIIEKLEADLKSEKEERKKLEGLMKSRGIPYSDGGGFQAEAPQRNGFDPSRRLTDQIVVKRPM